MKAKGVLIVSDDERHLLGDARPVRVSGDSPSIREDQQRAKLFAAAGDLLEGLKECLHALTAPRHLLRGVDEERWQRLIAEIESPVM